MTTTPDDPVATAERCWAAADWRGALDAVDAVRASGTWADDDRRWLRLLQIEAQSARFGRAPDASTRIERCDDAARAGGFDGALGWTRMAKLSVGARPSTDHDSVERELRAAADLCGRGGDPTGQAVMLAKLARDLAFRGRQFEAEGLIGEARRLAVGAAREQPELSFAWRDIGYVLAHLDDLEGAGRALAKAREIVERFGFEPAMPTVELWSGVHQLVSHNDEAAVYHLQRAEDRAIRYAFPFERDHARNLLATALDRLGRKQEADAYRAFGGPVNSTDVTDEPYLRGRALLDQGRLREAHALLAPLAGRLRGVYRAAVAALAELGAAGEEGDRATWDAVVLVADRYRADSPPDTFHAELALAAARAAVAHATTPVDLGRVAMAYRMAAHQYGRLGERSKQQEVYASMVDLRRRGAPVPLGPFLLVEPVGSGATGEVWRAVRPQGGEVAVKLLAPDADERLAAQLEDEVRATAALDHPNVVWVVDYGRVDEAAAAMEPTLRAGSPWLALELAPFGTLEERCGRLPWTEVRSLLLELLDALAHAHARGLVHLDLKPANVLVGGTADRPVARLADFGIAQLLRDRPSVLVAGTPAYMAPEQLIGHAVELGPWTDLYALGCLAVALVQGVPPFGDTTIEGLKHAHLALPPPPLTPRVAVPAGFDVWVWRLLAKSPANRFRSAADAARSLCALPQVTDPGSAVPAPLGATSNVADLPTVVLPAWDDAPPALEHSGGATPIPAPFVPRSFATRPAPQRPRGLREAGLGLFGVRAVPMIGRELERGVLWSALLDMASTERTRAVVLDGAPGVGTTSLSRWLCERASETGSGTPLEVLRGPDPWVDCLARALRTNRVPEVDALHRWLRTELERLGGNDDEARHVASLLEGTAGLSAQDRVRLIGRILGRLATERPLVIHVDGPTADTAAVVESLVDTLLPALFVVTVGEDRSWVEAMLDRDGVATIEVSALSNEVTGALLDAMIPLEPSTRNRLVEAARGNPDLAVQTVSDLVARGRLVPGPLGMELRHADGGVLPTDLDALWGDRLRGAVVGLLPRERRALAILAALGADATLPEWFAVCAALDAEPSAGLVDRLSRSGIVVARPDTLTFARSSLRITVAAAATSEDHAVCARILAERGAAADRIARHLRVARDPAAVDRWMDAATAALQAGRPRTAARALAEIRPAEVTEPGRRERYAALTARTR